VREKPRDGKIAFSGTVNHLYEIEAIANKCGEFRSLLAALLLTKNKGKSKDETQGQDWLRKTWQQGYFLH
jgi:hypothetical protein